jgi:hypothetical protein
MFLHHPHIQLIELTDDEDIISLDTTSEDDEIIGKIQINYNLQHFINNNLNNNSNNILNNNSNYNSNNNLNNNKNYKKIKFRKNQEINNFINFCIKKDLFRNNNPYDLNSIYSIVTTKLPEVFKILAHGKSQVKKKWFIDLFTNKYKYYGNIEFIYSCIDKKKEGNIQWNDFKDFFLPYVRNIVY